MHSHRRKNVDFCITVRAKRNRRNNKQFFDGAAKKINTIMANCLSLVMQALRYRENSKLF